MSVLELSSILVAVMLVTAPLVVRARPSAHSTPASVSRVMFLRFFLVAAISGMIAAVTVALGEQTPSAPLAGLANAAIVAGPTYFWAGMRQLRRPSLTPGWVAALATGVTFVVSTIAGLLTDVDSDGTGFRLALVTLGCAAVAAEAFTRPARRVPGFVASGIIFAVYGAYTLARLLGGFALGPDSSVYQYWFSALSAAIVTIPLVIATCATVWWIDRTLIARTERIESTIRALRRSLDSAGALTVYEISIPDLALIRVAFGMRAADAVNAAAAASLGRAAPDGIRHDDAGRHLLAIAGDVVIADLGAQAARAASGAVPTLDYREAIEVTWTRHVVRTEQELARLWPDVTDPTTDPSNAKDAAGSPVGSGAPDRAETPGVRARSSAGW